MDCLAPVVTPTATGLQQLPSNCYVASVALPDGGFAFAPLDSRDLAASVGLTDCDGIVIGYIYPVRTDAASVIVSDCGGTTYGYALAGSTVCPQHCYQADLSLPDGGYAFSPTVNRDPAATVELRDCNNVLIGYIYPHAAANSLQQVTDCNGAHIGYAASRDTVCVGQENPTCPDQSWVEGDYQVSVIAGCIHRKRVSYHMFDGMYQNPVITVTNGVISAVSEGSAVAAVRPELCNAQVTTGGTSTAPVVVNDPCNLLAADFGGQLSAYAFVQPAIGSGVSVSGCGTQADPFIIGYTPPPAAAAGITGLIGGSGITVSLTGTVATVSMSAPARAVLPLVTVGAGSGIWDVHGSPSTTYIIGSTSVTTSAAGVATITGGLTSGQVVSVTTSSWLVGYVLVP